MAAIIRKSRRWRSSPRPRHAAAWDTREKQAAGFTLGGLFDKAGPRAFLPRREHPSRGFPLAAIGLSPEHGLASASPPEAQSTCQQTAPTMPRSEAKPADPSDAAGFFFKFPEPMAMSRVPDRGRVAGLTHE